MLRSLLLVTAGAAGGWYAHRAFGPLVDREPARSAGSPRSAASVGRAAGPDGEARSGGLGPELGRRFAQRAGIDPDTIAQDLGQAAGDVAAAALTEGVNRFTERLKADAPPWVSALATRATVIAGETLDTPSSSSRGAAPAGEPGRRTAATPSAPTPKDPTA